MGIQQYMDSMGIDFKLSAFALAFGAAAAGIAGADMLADVAYIKNEYGNVDDYLKIYRELAERGDSVVGSSFITAATSGLSALFCAFSATVGLIHTYVEDVTKSQPARLSKVFALAATATGVMGMVFPIDLSIPLALLPGSDQHAMPLAAAIPGAMLVTSVAMNVASEYFRVKGSDLKPSV